MARFAGVPVASGRRTRSMPLGDWKWVRRDPHYLYGVGRRRMISYFCLRRLALRGYHHVGGLHFQVGEHAAGALPVHYFDEVHQIPFGVDKRRRYARRVVARLRVERHFDGLVVLVLGGVAI